MSALSSPLLPLHRHLDKVIAVVSIALSIVCLVTFPILINNAQCGGSHSRAILVWGILISILCIAFRAILFLSSSFFPRYCCLHDLDFERNLKKLPSFRQHTRSPQQPVVMFDNKSYCQIPWVGPLSTKEIQQQQVNTFFLSVGTPYSPTLPPAQQQQLQPPTALLGVAGGGGPIPLVMTNNTPNPTPFSPTATISNQDAQLLAAAMQFFQETLQEKDNFHSKSRPIASDYTKHLHSARTLENMLHYRRKRRCLTFKQLWSWIAFISLFITLLIWGTVEMSKLEQNLCPLAAQKGDYKAYHFTKSVVIIFWCLLPFLALRGVVGIYLAVHIWDLLLHPDIII